MARNPRDDYVNEYGYNSKRTQGNYLWYDIHNVRPVYEFLVLRSTVRVSNTRSFRLS